MKRRVAGPSFFVIQVLFLVFGMFDLSTSQPCISTTQPSLRAVATTAYNATNLCLRHADTAGFVNPSSGHGLSRPSALSVSLKDIRANVFLFETPWLLRKIRNFGGLCGIIRHRLSLYSPGCWHGSPGKPCC